MTPRELALAPFKDEELHTFKGKGGMDLTYIEDETVMDRLDFWPGPGNWQVLVEPIPVYEGVVKVRLGLLIDGVWIWYEDFGYPSNGTGGEALKESVSDGIRRCGRYVGIARDLYRKPGNGAPARPVTPPPAPARARPHVVDTDLLEPDDEEPFDEATAPMVRAEPVICPYHGFELKDRGYGLSCSGKVDKGGPMNKRGYCDWRPAA